MSNPVCHYESGVLIRCSLNKVKKITARYCRHCGGDLHPPIPISPGIFGKFSDSDKPVYRYDYLHSIADEEIFKYVDMAGDYWEYFKPGFPVDKIEVPEVDI